MHVLGFCVAGMVLQCSFRQQQSASSAGVALQMMLAEARTAALLNMAYQSCITVSAALCHQHT
jgi:hypothetical protein